MKAVLSLVLLVSAVGSDTAGECELAGFYLELGCTAQASQPGGCPDSFQCPDLHPDPNMCYYKGEAYSDRSTIPQAVVSNPCSQACSCETKPEPRFECAAVDCFESADRDLKACVQTYKLESCCNVGTVCGKDEIAKLQTCEYEGQTYREGESFEPRNTRKICVCAPRFNGSVDDPAYCRDVDCGIELHNQDKIMKNCAPVFAGNNSIQFNLFSKRGCPIDFQCPTNTTSIVRGLNLKSISAQCVFGNQTLGVGDEVATEDPCTKCVCEVPPFVACSRRLTTQQECARG